MEPYRTLAGSNYQPGEGGTSLANAKELILGLLNTVHARSVMEIGAFRGELTAHLVEWARETGAAVTAVDPAPPDELQALPDLHLIRETSIQALAHTPITDCVIIDGDHNYWTVREELRLIKENQTGHGPLLIVHDVGWPLGRRDTYHDPELVPDEYRQPLPPETGLSSRPDFAGDQPFAYVSVEEGGARNGVLTAIEDHLDAGMRLVIVPAFHGIGIAWPATAPWAAAVEALVGPLDRNPLLERLEADRCYHLIKTQFFR
jgi:hypothetical protein